ncbi:hypothetical protein TRAPUB_3396, partial [Trametes pubescens]
DTVALGLGGSSSDLSTISTAARWAPDGTSSRELFQRDVDLWMKDGNIILVAGGLGFCGLALHGRHRDMDQGELHDAKTITTTNLAHVVNISRSRARI